MFLSSGHWGTGAWVAGVLTGVGAWCRRCFDGETGELLWTIPEVHRGGVTALQVPLHPPLKHTGGGTAVRPIAGRGRGVEWGWRALNTRVAAQQCRRPIAGRGRGVEWGWRALNTRVAAQQCRRRYRGCVGLRVQRASRAVLQSRLGWYVTYEGTAIGRSVIDRHA